MQNVEDKIRGMVVGAVTGDALGMPLEFHPPRPLNRLVRDMEIGPLPAGTFTDDTEMALALAESLLEHSPLEGGDFAQRLLAWLRNRPADIGIHTSRVLNLIAAGINWQEAAERVQREDPGNAGNGSLMRAWPVAAVHHANLGLLIAESRLQSQITHAHPDCVNACVFLNLVLSDLIHRDSNKPTGAAIRESIAASLTKVSLGSEFELVVNLAPVRQRENLANSGWVRHTLESAFWAVLTTYTFEEALVSVVNLGNDADTAGAVTGAIAGALYGYAAIPEHWKGAIHGEYPLRSGRIWFLQDFINLADEMMELG